MFKELMETMFKELKKTMRIRSYQIRNIKKETNYKKESNGNSGLKSPTDEKST